MSAPGPYDLSNVQLRDIFDAFIRPQLLGQFRPSRAPVVVLLGGQPGAGKTRATNEIRAQCRGSDITAIVGDDFRSLHPAYARLVSEAPALMPDATAPAAGAWVRMGIDLALETRSSILVEGTFRRPEVTLGEADRFKAAGYQTHLIALSVPASLSRLSTLGRYVEDHRRSGEARWTPLEGHDAGYAGTPATVAAAERHPAIDRISVYNRDGTETFTASRRDGDPIQGAATAVEIGRLAKLPALPALGWLRDLHNDVTYVMESASFTSSMVPLMTQLLTDAQGVIPAAHPDPTSAGYRDATRTIEADGTRMTALLRAREAQSVARASHPPQRSRTHPTQGPAASTGKAPGIDPGRSPGRGR